MLQALSIRDVVLIERLDLSFGAGLSVLTGETGAGKSILLDALGLALGARADSGLVRHGAERAAVTAGFALPPAHPVRALLADQGLPDGDELLLRRVLTADGRSRAFANDEPVSVGLLRQLGESLVEVQGQFELRGLLDPATHAVFLDGFGRLETAGAAVADAWAAWRAADAALDAARQDLEQARREEDFLRHAAEELEQLAPEPDEEEHLADQRTALMHRERLVEALRTAQAELQGHEVDQALRAAQRALERVADKAGGRLDEAVAALDRAGVELDEATAQIQAASTRIERAEAQLEQVEERLFALRAAARKHRVDVAALPELRERFRARLAALDESGAGLDALAGKAAAARDAYRAAAAALSGKRAAAARQLDAAVANELPPLKLERATFRTRVESLPEAAWGPSGTDRVAFEVATNPGAPFGPLARIASGGELARFMLALKVVLARVGSARTLVFDEVDAGIGGAVAAAVGERLARLAEEVQVLVVTHSPQVAARGRRHWQVSKALDPDGAATAVAELDAAARQEEIARMLSGARITDEARAAAASLMAQAGA